MRNRIFFVLNFFLSICLNNVYSQEALVGGIIYGNNWALLLKAPDGWRMDQESLAHVGIYGLFYEKEKTFSAQANMPIIYVQTTKLNEISDEEFKRMTHFDINNRTSNTGSSVQQIRHTFQEENKIYFLFNVDLPNGRRERFVYTRYGEVLVIIVLHTRNDIERDTIFPKMVQLINDIVPIDKR